jgi:small subunit ribosomal protein S27e
MVPKPHSNFLSVQCSNCGEKVVIFNYRTTDIECKACGQLVAKKTGGKAKIMGKVLSVLD